MIRALAIAAPLLGLLIGLAAAREGAEPWAAARTPATGDPESVGSYSAGCLRGGQALPLTGTGYQVMRPSRGRNFGHPSLIAFIGDLGRQVKSAELGVVLVGDLGQPRGGPAPSGHASHQSGLDVDLWYWHPKAAERRTLSRKQREQLAARPMADLTEKRMTKSWSPRTAKLIRLAAQDTRVTRVFVNPLIKRALCESSGDDRAWLRKVRPWWGHHAHFHVRLACPAASPDCEPQKEPAAGDGCDAIDWWLDDKAQADRKKGQSKYRSKLRTMPELPPKCDEVLTATPMP